jgi:ketosteroid isomerase-like protein
VPHANLARAAATASDAKAHPLTPEVKLVDGYTSWFLGGAYAGDTNELKAGLTKYITDKTVLHEPVSFPWGGTMVGYDGWVHLSQRIAPIFAKVNSHLEVSSPVYYQRGHVVIRETTVTVKSTPAAPQPFVTGLMEKFTFENGRIAQIDEYFQDIAGFVDRLAVVGAIPAAHKQ